ncbi:MAG: hypothetical protein JRN13_03230 [Nitrososphaerota archaeon]|nr:hypothetical protein [Nitrososphaerota archaeon]MDG6937093.1 hypothetical protein [Nitrososphaerota archaeon]MDG6972335.1 hypothetical protein [Nitrososphaerota archaeon]MDG7017895.1 hypothetical protein [Nitrososphaerota archaeon]
MQKWDVPLSLGKLPEIFVDFAGLYLESVRIRAQYKRPVESDPRELGELVALFDAKLVKAAQALYRKSPQEFEGMLSKVNELRQLVRKMPTGL